MSTAITQRLEYLRQELRAERISWSELAELQDLAEHIEPGDVELLEAAARRYPTGLVHLAPCSQEKPAS